MELRKVKGECNPADLFTKHLPSGVKIVDLLSLLNCVSSSGRPSAAPALKTVSSSSNNSPTAVLSVLPSDSSIEHIVYHGRVFPCSEYEGQRLPEAYGHDESILPHQHEDLEERFPRAHVPVAADADEILSEPDSLEQRGAALGRSDPTGDSTPSQSRATGALALYAMSAVRTRAPDRKAMAPRAASAACVQPSRKKYENKKNENLQGRLPRQNPSRAMTPHAMSDACVSPWQSYLHGGARGKRPCPSGKTTAVAGTYAVQIGSPTTGGSKTAGTANSFLQKSTRGSAGKPGCLRVRRHALTVAFELLRWHHAQRCPCPPSWSGHAYLRQEVRAHPPE